MLSGIKFIPRDQIDKKEKDEKPETRKSGHRKEKKHSRHSSSGSESSSGGSKGSRIFNSNDVLRKEMGLEWMLRPKDGKESKVSLTASVEEKDNPREPNPYLRNDGGGYPEDSEGPKSLLSNTVVGEDGASWRLKALKRPKEQAVREGRQLQEVVEERWDSMGHLAASVASHKVAPTHAHLHATKQRRKGLFKEDVTPRHPKMRVPKVDDSLSWGKWGNKNMSAEDNVLVSSALPSSNKFLNDGNFLALFTRNEESVCSKPEEARAEPKSVEFALRENNEDVGTVKPTMIANQLAAKAIQLRWKGKHEEAEKLLKEVETIKESQNAGDWSKRQQIDGTRVIMQKRKEDDGDLHLAQNIVHNHGYSVSGQADEEYDDYDDSGPRNKNRKKNHQQRWSSSQSAATSRFLTQQDRCQFCFENPFRPKHLVVAIANFTYLALPQQQPLVSGHCRILTLQHESSTMTVEDNVRVEIRNFKKCLINMFGKQEKDVVFLETVMGLAQQRRHCMVECVPLPCDVAKQASVYFKKAIDDAGDEWSQHKDKPPTPTSQKGLCGLIPKNLPYFHVEFGLNKGYVHVIEDEKEFKSSFGLDVIRGMLQLPTEDMHRCHRQESFERQKQAVMNFARDWEPFDWTKQLE